MFKMNEWYYLKGSDKVGPITLETVKELIHSFEITESTRLWKKGLKAWTNASEIEDFKGSFPSEKSNTNQNSSEPPEMPPDDMPPALVPFVIKENEKTYCLIMYLSYFCCWGIIPLIMWLTKRNESKFINDNGINILNHLLTFFPIFLLNIPLLFLFVGFITIPIVWIASLVLMIIAGVKAKNGEVWQYTGFNFIKIK